MEHDKEIFRHVLLHYFDLKRNLIESDRLLSGPYSDAAPLKTTYKEWFQRFKSDNFNVKDKQRITKRGQRTSICKHY